MPRPSRNILACLALGALAQLVGQGCGAPPARVKLSIDLSDEAFCPGGILVNAPKKHERVDVRIGVRSQDSQTLQYENNLLLKIYPVSEPLEVVARQEVPVSMKVGETWRRPLDTIQFVPPSIPGNYVAEISSPGGAWASTRFGVWYDRAACPAPGSKPIAADPTPVSTPLAPSPSKPIRKSPLLVALDAQWECNVDKGVEDLEVKVRVTNPKSSGRALRGFRPVVKGIDELEAFERIAGETPGGYLAPGSSVMFRAFGWIENGRRAVRLGVVGGGPPVAEGLLRVDCSAGAGHRGGGRVPEL